MIGAIIGGALALGGTVAGGLMSGAANRKQKKQTLAEKQAEKQWYDKKIYEDPTQRASTQLLLNRTKEMLRERNTAARGMQAVVGGTEESVQATKEANAKAMADIVSNIVVSNEARKDGLEESQRATDKNYRNQLDAIEAQRNANIAQAVQGAMSAMGNIAGNLDSAQADYKAAKADFNATKATK